MSKVNIEKFKLSKSALNICLHPLVIINISDHYTRTIIDKKPIKNIYGFIIGTQKRRKVELRTSFEMLTKNEKQLTIDTTVYKGRLSQYEQVFKNYEVLGWYRVGENVEKSDFQMHQKIMELTGNDNPIFLLCGADFGSEVRELPIHMFESVVEGVDSQGNDQLSWRYLNTKIETEISEQVSLDHISKNIQGGGKESRSLQTFNKMANATQMLQQRLKIIVKYLEYVKAGKVPFDHDLVRKCSYLSKRLPAVDSQKFDKSYLDELNETLLITYMSVMTKCTNNLNDLVDKFNVCNEHSRRGGNRMFREMF